MEEKGLQFSWLWPFWCCLAVFLEKIRVWWEIKLKIEEFALLRCYESVKKLTALRVYWDLESEAERNPRSLTADVQSTRACVFR